MRRISPELVTNARIMFGEKRDMMYLVELIMKTIAEFIASIGWIVIGFALCVNIEDNEDCSKTYKINFFYSCIKTRITSMAFTCVFAVIWAITNLIA
ncbi:MAG TPA: hypothetical protein GX707_07045 [Epulopiscium sp.]|nr:hypothetical protein [Candidatus Epulonipiscium sp.]